MAECDLIETLQTELDYKRAAASGVHEHLLKTLAHCQNPTVPIPPALTDAQISARDADQAERERLREREARAARWAALVRDRGNRYGECRLRNFATEHESQKAAVRQLTDYCLDITDRIAKGEGLILFGPKGTGKDHLAMAVARVAIQAGKYVTWQNGMDFFGDIRDRMDGSATERSLVARLVSPDVLYLSDPLPPLGSLTEFQAGMLFRVLDGRYSRRKPTWVTANTSNGIELDTKIGPQNGDRLRDGALAVFCDWPSYRKTMSR